MHAQCQVSFARTHAHILLLLTCQCQSRQSHRFSGFCTRDSSAKFYGTHGRHPQTREAVPECKKGANAETLCVAPRSSVHCSQALESRLSGLHSHGGYTLPFPCSHSSAAEKSERPDVCMLQKKIHKALANAKEFFIH